MRIEFDQAKDATNQAKHCVPMSLAAELDWDTLQCLPDTRKDYGEPRMIGYALCGQRLYCVVYVDRGNTRRIISLRRANEREVIRYVRSSS